MFGNGSCQSLKHCHQIYNPDEDPVLNMTNVSAGT